MRTGKLKQHYTVVGIGAGPSNLSFAALGSKVPLDLICLDRKKQFSWHGGMLLEQSKLQVHYLKDCVSLVDPTNPYSFLNYLVKKRRVYQFMNRKSEIISRQEYNDYLHWIENNLDNVYYGCSVDSISYKRGLFYLDTTLGEITADHLVIGAGRIPYVPEDFTHLLGPRIYHNAEYLTRKENYHNKRVVVIGGGQSGAEIIYDQLEHIGALPKSITWISKRLNFHPLEDSCFANAFYTPSYAHYFYNLSYNKKEKLLNEQILTSDGITKELIDKIYDRLYDLKFLFKSTTRLDTLVKHTLKKILSIDDFYRLSLYNAMLEKTIIIDADVVIFATGYKAHIPTCFNKINKMFNYLDDGQLNVNYDYSVAMNEPIPNRIFIQNGSRHMHGVADANLSLSPWRSSQIINAILECDFYPTHPGYPIFSMKNLETDHEKQGVNTE